MLLNKGGSHETTSFSRLARKSQGWNGTVSTESGVLKQAQYSFDTRFESGIGTNPEELIAAAHAGCFSMALSVQLGDAGLTADKIETTAVVTFEKNDEGWSIVESHLKVSAVIPGATPEGFAELAQAAKTGCPVSRLLNATITMDAILVM
jgi:osmotically inducible protein OsmC